MAEMRVRNSADFRPNGTHAKAGFSMSFIVRLGEYGGLVSDEAEGSPTSHGVSGRRPVQGR